MEFVTVAIIAYGPFGNAYALAGLPPIVPNLSVDARGSPPWANPPHATKSPRERPEGSSRPPPRSPPVVPP
ncbi:MAG: hypothetical protein IRY85_15765 [Micromonosporaceae bacterium]|nr:hypothetical protein [Micromonosporaceae bacterium]